jgi:cysteine desulfurase
VPGVEGESLMLGLEPVCAASGSACNSTSCESSYVLRALGRDDALAQSAIRFSFGRTTTTAEIDIAIERYRRSVDQLRSMAPLNARSS